MTRQTGIAVFDLDHTLSRSDSFLWYLIGFLVRRPWRITRCLHLPIVVLSFAVGMVNNAKLKEAFLHAVLGGVRYVDLVTWNRAFVDWFVHCRMRREGLATLEGHRQAGDRLILLTASPDCYVTELGHRLGFDEVICTKVEWKAGRLSGNLTGPNMRGEEKVRALQSIRSRYRAGSVTAYADHWSDLGMLRLADYGILVNGGRKAKTLAHRDGIQCVMWRG